LNVVGCGTTMVKLLEGHATLNLVMADSKKEEGQWFIALLFHPVRYPKCAFIKYQKLLKKLHNLNYFKLYYNKRALNRKKALSIDLFLL